MSRLLVISFTDLASDPRVDRQIRCLKSHYQLIAAGLGPPRHEVDEFIELSTPDWTPWGQALWLARLLTRRFDDAFWKQRTNTEALDKLRRVGAEVVVANELTALPIALKLGAPVVFDAHEYAPREFDHRARWRLIVGPYARWQCRRYIPQTAGMMTVGNAIAAEYGREIGVRPVPVTNAPPREDLQPTAVHEPIRVLHHGGATRGRGLEDMIRVARMLDERFVTTFVLVDVVAGYRDELIRLAEDDPRIRFLPPQPMHALALMANDHDIGMYLLRPANFNQRFALPNKFFEFIQGRLAVAIGPSPEMARIVNQYGLGVVADDFAPETLARKLNSVDGSAIAGFKRASHAAADELCAERNEELILQVVEGALAASR